jgi:hypothetical protein
MDRSPGSSLATLLKGSWRRHCPPVHLSEAELARLTPLLLQSGAGGLGWYHVRHTALRTSSPARTLQQAYRFHAMRAAVYERAIQRYIQALRAAGVEPLLFKGWTVARLYPEPYLRPYGDIDLVVKPAQYATADLVLKQVRIADCYVDLHRSLGWLSDQRWESLTTHAEVIRLGEVDVRILGPEDHLVLLCRHFLRHNAWRPLWLCDIAAALEARPADFDWARCLGTNRRRADWVACTLGLAHQLLDARVEDTPVAARAKNLPSWLRPAVLRQWDRCQGPGPLGTVVAYVASHWRRPRDIIAHARLRWDMPIAATMALRGPLNEFPRGPFQLGLALAHIPLWCRDLGGYFTQKAAASATK